MLPPPLSLCSRHTKLCIRCEQLMRSSSLPTHPILTTTSLRTKPVRCRLLSSRTRPSAPLSASSSRPEPLTGQLFPPSSSLRLVRVSATRPYSSASEHQPLHSSQSHYAIRTLRPERLSESDFIHIPTPQQRVNIWDALAPATSLCWSPSTMNQKRWRRVLPCPGGLGRLTEAAREQGAHSTASP